MDRQLSCLCLLSSSSLCFFCFLFQLPRYLILGFNASACISHGQDWVVAHPEGETDKPAPSWRPQKRSGEGNCGESKVEEFGILVRRNQGSCEK